MRIGAKKCDTHVFVSHSQLRNSITDHNLSNTRFKTNSFSIFDFHQHVYDFIFQKLNISISEKHVRLNNLCVLNIKYTAKFKSDTPHRTENAPELHRTLYSYRLSKKNVACLPWGRSNRFPID